MRRLCELFPGARIDAVNTYSGRDRECRGHGRQYDVYQQFDLYWGEGRQKLPVYCELLRRLMAIDAVVKAAEPVRHATTHG